MADTSFGNDVWINSDVTSATGWTLLTSSANYYPRDAHILVVYNNMLVMK
jgi:hypothetical protein